MKDDIARAAAQVAAGEGHENKVYNLCNCEAYSTGDLCRTIAEVTGKKVEFKNASDEDYIKAGIASGDPEPLVRALLTMYWSVRDGAFGKPSSDIESLTGKKPISFKEALVSSKTE